MDSLVFEHQLAWRIGVPLVLAALALSFWALSRRGLSKQRAALLTGLRAVALLPLVLLAAKPTWVSRQPAGPTNQTVVLLFDRSESMSIEEGEKNRYQQALEFARAQLLPALKASSLAVEAFLFAEDAEPADGANVSSALPKGRRTNLARAIARAVESSPVSPLAVIGLTDGVANESADNARGLTALVDHRVPFIGLGFGGDTGARTLSLRLLDAPPTVSTNTVFRVSAELEMTSAEEVPPFDLVLMREGRIAQKKTVQPGKGSRLWLESFRVSEPLEGPCHYAVQFLPPVAPNLKCANTMASTVVQVSGEKDLRVLYVQGALTWDFKFAALALKGDPAIKLTGLTRTAKQSIFRQNVESAEELVHGFPVSLKEMAPFRVVVLANLSLADLSLSQQDLLARFCSELGGGVLMIGGAPTFTAAWQGSRLEQMLPVTFVVASGVSGLDRPFHLRLTDEAVMHPLFQIANDRPVREAWARLPTFTQYGRVGAAKPGAQVWMEHPQDEGPQGRCILMASQRFGAGVSAVLCVQNLWRWRLARDSDPQQFDRFWRQLLRFLSEPSRQEVIIHLADQDLRPHADVRLAVERRPAPSDVPGVPQTFTVRFEEDTKKIASVQTVELLPGRPLDLSFRVEEPGLYRASVVDLHQNTMATRAIEIRDLNLEFQDTARNMETLRQWASLSDGLALKMEECPGGDSLVAQIKRKIDDARRFKPLRRPAGVDGWVLSLVLAALGAEWLLRKQWGLR